MTSESVQHHRRSIRLPAYDYSAPGAYFITIITHGRICLFGEVTNGQMRLSDRGLIADRVCVLASHPRSFSAPTLPSPKFEISIALEVKMLCSHLGEVSRRGGRGDPTRPNGPKRGSVGAIIGAYKMAVTRAVVRQLGERASSEHRPLPPDDGRENGGVPRLWQRNYYEHVIRDDDDHNRIHLYIESNVINWTEDEENPLR